MPSPIPLLSGDNAGTGFLVTDATTVWLVTCVHIISGLHETPLMESIFRMAEIRVAGTPAVLPLFVDGRPRISVVTNTTTDHLVDAIATKLQPREIAGLIDYGMFEVGSIVKAKVGDIVIAAGFPALGGSITAGATTFHHREMRYEVDIIEGVSIRLSKPSAEGISGGPVVNEEGLIGIMHGDVGASASMTNGLAISLDVIGEHLFV